MHFKIDEHVFFKKTRISLDQNAGANVFTAQIKDKMWNIFTPLLNKGRVWLKMSKGICNSIPTFLIWKKL